MQGSTAARGWAPAAGLLIGRVDTGIDLATALNWLLRVACCMCFVGHGAWGVITKAGWLPFYEIFGIPEWFAWQTMPLIGTMDITLGIMALFHPCRAMLAYMGFWAVFTALLRPLAGMGWWELLERGGNYGPPIAFYMIATAQGLGWFDRVRPAPIAGEVLRRVRWTLQISIALLLIGHGGFGAFQAKKLLVDHWSAAGVAADVDLVRMIGAAEILAGLAVLFVTARPYLLLIAYYKVATELLYPLAGSLIDTWEWVERGGDYVGPLALICTLALLERRKAHAAAAPAARPPVGLAAALRVGAACFAFTAAVNFAYVSTSVSFKVRDVHFEEYSKLIEYGYDRAGWLPHLPVSSRNIRERHEVDSGQVVASFTVADPAELDRYLESLRARAAGSGACEPPARLLDGASFWPPGFSGVGGSVESVRAEGDRMFSVDRKAGQVYYWTCT